MKGFFSVNCSFKQEDNPAAESVETCKLTQLSEQAQILILAIF